MKILNELQKPLAISALVLGSVFLAACTKQTQPLEEGSVMEESQEGSEQEAMENEGTTATPGGMEAAGPYTLAEVTKHSTPQDCWMAIDGKVYDVSGFGEGHPGGEAVYEGCGQDATELYNTRPMGSKTPHSEKARDNLVNFYIGDLAK